MKCHGIEFHSREGDAFTSGAKLARQLEDISVAFDLPNNASFGGDLGALLQTFYTKINDLTARVAELEASNNKTTVPSAPSVAQDKCPKNNPKCDIHLDSSDTCVTLFQFPDFLKAF